MPNVERVQAPSSASAAQKAAEDPSGHKAAIGSHIAAEAYGLKVVESGIEDRRDNSTRFLVLGRTPPSPSGRDLTSVVFTIRKDQAGGLFRLIQPFAKEGVNLTTIQLRPIHGKPWEYLFFLDLEVSLREMVILVLDFLELTENVLILELELANPVLEFVSQRDHSPENATKRRSRCW